MSQITLDIPDETLLALKVSHEEAGDALRIAAAMKLFELGQLSSGAAAQLAGIPRVVFLSRLADYDVDTFRLTEESSARKPVLHELICDTSPLQYLHQLGLLDLLPRLVRGVVVPPAVDAELSVGRSLGLQLPELSLLDWLTIRRPASAPALPLGHDLGPGETEALRLALESPGTIVVLDDSLARRVAESLNLPFTGTLGLLLDAKKLGLIEAVQPHLDRLQALRFRVSPRTRSIILELAGEM